MKPEKPTPDDFATAIAWLNHNDGDNGEAEACSRVAEWLRAKMEDEALRGIARAEGIPFARLRAAMSDKLTYR
jgi:hypothetical protein